MQPPAPSPQHQWLARLVGEWASEMPHRLPDGTEIILRSTETARMIGHFWLLLEGKGDMPDGGICEYQITIGFNSETGRFPGTWIGSPMPTLWLYDGELSADETVLTLHCKGPFFDGKGGTTDFQDIIEIQDADHRLFTGRYRDRNGEWVQMMQSRATRVST